MLDGSIMRTDDKPPTPLNTLRILAEESKVDKLDEPLVMPRDYSKMTYQMAKEVKELKKLKIVIGGQNDKNKQAYFDFCRCKIFTPDLLVKIACSDFGADEFDDVAQDYDALFPHWLEGCVLAV